MFEKKLKPEDNVFRVNRDSEGPHDYYAYSKAGGLSYHFNWNVASNYLEITFSGTDNTIQNVYFYN